jgi:protein ImuB
MSYVTARRSLCSPTEPEFFFKANGPEMFACLYVPDFPVQAAMLTQAPDAREALRKSPIAILDGPANLPRVIALNNPARDCGIELGMTKLQVETCSDVLLRNRSTADEDVAHARLVEYASSFSPIVESAGPGVVLLDLIGTERLHGSPKDIANEMSVVARERGFELHVSVASNPDTALYAARGFAGVNVIPDGHEAKRLARLKVELLPVDEQMLAVLNGWGIYTFKSLADLPIIALTERLGQQGQHLQKLARGQVKRTLFPPLPTQTFVQSHEFENPVESLEFLFFELNRALQEICFGFASHGLSTNEVRLTLELEVRQHLTGEKHEFYEHTWKLPAPTIDAKMILTLIRLELERSVFIAPVSKLAIEALPIKPQTAQGNLFAPPSPEAGQLEISLAQIRTYSGDVDSDGQKCFGSPALVDTHEPGTFSVTHFTSFTDVTRSRKLSSTAIALRRFRPALVTSVEFKGDSPTAILLWGQNRRVLKAYGPWCGSGNWWDDATAWAREEWDVALKTYAGVGVFRIYLDRIRKQWFVEGMFD